MDELANAIKDYGFPIIAAIGLGYFVYYIWWFVGEQLEPEIEKQHFALIKVIDKVRMLDQDLIRLQQKVDVVLEYKENEEKRKTVNDDKTKDSNN